MIQNSIKKWVSRYSKKQKLILALLGTTTLALVALLVWLGVTGRLGIGASTTGRVYFTAQNGTGTPQNTEVPKTWRTPDVKVTLSEEEFVAMGYPNESKGNSSVYKTYFDRDKHVWHISIASNYPESKRENKWGYFVIQSLNSKEEVLNQITDNYYHPSNIIDFPVVRGAKYARVQYHTKDKGFLPWWRIDISKLSPNEGVNDANLAVYSGDAIPKNFVGRRCLPGSGQIAIFNSADYASSRVHDYDIELGRERACEILPAGNYVNLDNSNSTDYPKGFDYLISNKGPYSSSIHTRSGNQVYGNSYPMNDAISSILVRNATVTVYKDRQYSGESATYNGHVKALGGTGFNDTISSLKVTSTVPRPPSCGLLSSPGFLDVPQGGSVSAEIKALGGTVPAKANIETKVWSGMGPGTTLYTKNDLTVDLDNWPKLTVKTGTTLAIGSYTVEVIDKTNNCMSTLIIVNVLAQCQLVATPDKLDIDYKKSGTVTISATNHVLDPNQIGAIVVGGPGHLEPIIKVEKVDGLKYKITSLEGSNGKSDTVLFAPLNNVDASMCRQVAVPVKVGNIKPLSIKPVSFTITTIPYVDQKVYAVENIVRGAETAASIENTNLATISRYFGPETDGTGYIYITANRSGKNGTTKVNVSDKLQRSASATLEVKVTQCRDDQTRNNDGVCVCKGANEVDLNGKCQCKDGFVKIGGACVAKAVCVGDMVRDPKTNECVCPDGYSRIGTSDRCQINCADPKVPSSDGKTCVCPAGTEAVGDDCLSPFKISSFTANPGEIEKGGESTLSWKVDGVTDDTTCHITGPNGYSIGVEKDKIASGSEKVSPTGSSTYTLNCADHGRNRTQNVTVRVKEITSCPTGQRLVGGECVTITCPDGEILRGNDCVCPEGQIRGTSGKCRPESCPTGQRLVGDECVAITCPTGEILRGNDCVCPEGQTRGENGRCQPTSCPTGQRLVGGECVTITCPTGEILRGNDCVCPEGQIRGTSGKCRPESCPTGQRLVGDECVAITCPKGEILRDNDCVCPEGQTRGEDGRCEAPRDICAPGQIADIAPTGVWEIKTLPTYAKTDGLTLDKYLGLGVVNYFFDGFKKRYGFGEEGLAENFTGGIGHWRKNKNTLAYICLNVNEQTNPSAPIVRQLPHKALNMVGKPHLDRDVAMKDIKFKFSSTGDRELNWHEAVQAGLLKAAFVWRHSTTSYLAYTNLSLYPNFTEYGYQDFSTFSDNMPDNGMWISTRSTETVTVIF